MKLKLALVSMSLLLGGCICVHEDAPTVKYYRALSDLNGYQHHEVRPIRTSTHVGYQDDRGNIYLWPAN